MQSGKVIGQLATITSQSEQGATEAMSCLEKSIASLDSAVQELDKLKSTVPGANVSGLEQHLTAIQDQLFAAMSAFQFQDISTQKLYKVMSLLADLSDYLNDLVGFPNPRPSYVVAKGIESVDLVKDKSKSNVDDLVKQFQGPLNG
jgi:chemotaxis regulatin CheY-phosphate phosphatase CheZ